jgi:CRISPR/Cas system-associated exonuclease Cas4 (RecB family)
MKLPEGFVFSQSSMQDYRDCPRRFQLRYLERRRWPAPQTSDALDLERWMQQGYAFHRLMTRFHSGIRAPTLEVGVAADEVLQRWWDGYRQSPPRDLPDQVVRPELALSARLRGYRLEARFDLLTGQPGDHWVIVDWKTGRHRAPRGWWAQRLQTHVYPFVLVRAGAALNGGRPISASQVQMAYWFAQFPAQPEVFDYDERVYRGDEDMLGNLVLEIEGRAEEPFPKTEDRWRCRYCVYRSLCWDDVQAGLSADMPEAEAFDEWEEDIELEQVLAIPY